MEPKNSNYEEREDGYYKKDESTGGGYSPFDKPIPPVDIRDADGRPIHEDGSLDVEKFIQEIGKK